MQKLTFDLETTSADSSNARIVQLAIRVTDEEGYVLISKAKMYNPEVPISKEATDVHGITDDMVKDMPTFKQDAKKLKLLFENKIIVSFNGLVFDLPILMNSFERAGVDVELSGKFIDVLRIERKLNTNTLSDVYKRYTGESLEGAHDALIDVTATEKILECQIKNHSLDDEALYEMSGANGMADYYGKLKYDDKGFLIYNFGAKCKGKRVVDEPSYSKWVLGEAFPEQVKRMIRDEQTKGLKKRSIPFKETTPESFKGKTTVEGYVPLSDDLPF